MVKGIHTLSRKWIKYLRILDFLLLLLFFVWLRWVLVAACEFCISMQTPSFASGV